MIMNVELDYNGNAFQGHQHRFSKEVENAMLDLNLIDIWRERKPLKRQFTYTKSNPFMQSRIDYWLISEELERLVIRCDIVPSIAPDHSAIALFMYDKIENDKDTKKGSYWKFNNSLCGNIEYVNKMKEEIVKLKDELITEIVDRRVLWDYLKMKIRVFTQTFSKRLARERREKRQILENEVVNIEHSLAFHIDEELVKKLENKKKELGETYDYINEGIKIRSRASWYESGERDSRYFNQLLQINKKKSIIKKLVTENGEIIDQQKEVLNQIKTFYTNLYSRKEIEITDLNFFRGLPTISNENKELCEGDISEGECFAVIKEMKHNKAPGNDGLTAEFYYTFWAVIKDVMLGAFREAYVLGELSASQKQAVIILIAKDGKDPHLVKNYRPISLLNIDYKIISKVLAKKIKEVLENVILMDQIGFMKGRNIGEAIRIIDDIIFHTSNKNSPGYLVVIDFEKAFDSISHIFLLRVLNAFGFGPKFCKWVKILYTKAQSCIFNGGISTGYFNVERGVRQGDPLSSYLFILCIEILANNIRYNDSIQGICFGEHEVKQVMYADDMTIFVRNEDSIKNVVLLLENFRKISGLKVNNEKTKIMLLGSLQGKCYNLNFGYKVDFVRILGVIFSLDVEIKEKLNYKEILSKIKRLLNWWKQRDLTLMGKIQLLKLFIYSKFIYVASLTPVPKWVYDELDQLTFQFLWRGRNKIKKNTMYLDYQAGGLKMMNFELLIKAQRVMWVKRLLEDKDMKWKQYFQYATNNLGGKFIFSCDFILGLLKVILPQFYINLLEVWTDTKDFQIKYDPYKGNEVIFNNKFIRVNGKCIFHQNLFIKNIYKLKHIMDNNGILKPITYFQQLGLEEDDIKVIKAIYGTIPINWKRNMRRNEDNTQETEGIAFVLGKNIVAMNDIVSKRIYASLIKKHSVTPEIFDKMKEKFNFTYKDTENIFRRPRKCTLNSRLREFQFKLIHGIIYTNHHLFRFGFVQNALCAYCKKEEETYRHIFFECQNARFIWNNSNDILNLIPINNLKWQDILFGIYLENQGKEKLVNHFLILVKYLIFRGRERGSPITINEIKSMFKEEEWEEKRLALERNTISLHLKKWEHLKS